MKEIWIISRTGRSGWSSCLPVGEFKLVNGVALGTFSWLTGNTAHVRDVYWFRAWPMLGLKARFVFEGGTMLWLNDT